MGAGKVCREGTVITQESDGSPHTSGPRPAPSSRRADTSVSMSSIRQRVGLIAEQLAAPRNRDWFRPVIPTINEVHGGPPEGRLMTIRVCWDCALRRADLESARRCPWSADEGCCRHRPAGSRAPRGDGRRVARDRHMQAFGRDMDAQAPRRTRFSTTLGLRDDASKRVRSIASQVRRLTRSVTA